MAETYNANVICGNCGWYGVTPIRKGLRVSIALRSLKCPTCGCTTLGRR